MPRVRKPLSRKDPNVVVQEPAPLKSAKVSFKDQATSKAKPEATLPEPKAEVELLRAQVEELTAKLEEASLDQKKSNDVKPTIISNPFGGSMIADSPAPSDSSSQMITSPMISTVGPPPKRPPTAYNLFVSDHREQVREQHPELNSHQVTGKVAEMWSQASDDTRVEYESKCSPDRERFESEKEIYDAKVAAVEEERQAVTWMQEEMKKQRAMQMYEAHMSGKPEQALPKIPKDEGEIKKPKNPRSAYLFFQMRRHLEMSKQAEKSGTPKPGDAITIISEEWRGLQTSRRKKDKAIVKECNDLAADDHERYERDLEMYKAEVESKEKVKAEESRAFKERAIEMFRAQKKDREELTLLRKLQAEQKKVEKVEKAAAREAKKAEKAEKALLPKRPRNAYALYFAEKAKDADFRAQSQQEGVSMAGLIGAMWKGLSDEEKKPFTDMAAADRIRYQNEMASLKE